MIIFRIKFDEQRALENGRIASELMDDVRKYLNQYPSTVQLNETMWRDDSEEAMGIFGELINQVCDDNTLFYSLEYMSWNIDGVEEDNIQCELEWRRRHRGRK